ncbi:hypothetical protein LJK88_28645 [Paenibacillus sp. P26]|nr:hypothetical protein LJK88_28645 [Paenibacillus sp. P26]
MSLMNKRLIKKNDRYELAPSLARALGSRGGIVRSLMSMSPDAGDPPLFVSVAAPANPRHLLRDATG